MVGHGLGGTVPSRRTAVPGPVRAAVRGRRGSRGPPAAGRSSCPMRPITESNRASSPALPTSFVAVSSNADTIVSPCMIVSVGGAYRGGGAVRSCSRLVRTFLTVAVEVPASLATSGRPRPSAAGRPQGGPAAGHELPMRSRADSTELSWATMCLTNFSPGWAGGVRGDGAGDEPAELGQLLPDDRPFVCLQHRSLWPELVAGRPGPGESRRNRR